MWGNLAVAYRETGTERRGLYEGNTDQALSVKPDYTKALFGLGVVYGESGQAEQAPGRLPATQGD